MIRGRKPAGGGVHNPPSRRAVYEQRTYGSVGAGAGNRPGYPSAAAGRAASAGVPDPELVEQAQRRRFTAEYKLRILREADACTKPGEIGELLRREGLYTSHLTYWRKQRREGALKELGKPRGRKPADRRDQEIAELNRRNERLDRSWRRPRRSLRFRETSLRSWSRCSVPRARAGAPSDDLRHGQPAHAGDRYQAGVPRAGRLAGDDLPSSAAACVAQAAQAQADAGEGAV